MSDAPVVLRILGPVEVEWRRAEGTIPQPRLSNRRAARLLALLAVEPGPHTPDELVARLVDHAAAGDDKSARNSLHRAVTDAGACLGPASHLLSFNRGLGYYVLERDTAVLEIDFDQAATKGTQGEWQATVDLHRGPLAQGLEDRWLDDKRKNQRQALAVAIAELHPDLGPHGVDDLVETVLAGQPLPRGAKAALTYARDVLVEYDLHGNQIVGKPAQITGIVTRKVATKERVFLDVADSGGQTLQVVVESGSPAWEASLSAQRPDKVLARGTVQVMEPRHSRSKIVSIVADELISRRVAGRAVIPSDATLSSAPHVGTYVARLTNHFRACLGREGFVEVSTRLISTDWPDDGVEVLRVMYDGYGPDSFYLCPSPIQQLIDEIIESPFQRVFSVGACITPTYRDPHVSTEATVVGTVALDFQLEALLARIHAMAVDLLVTGHTAPLRPLIGEVTTRSLTWPASAIASGVTRPEIQLFQPEDMGSGSDGRARPLIARLCWPFDDPDPQLQDYVLAEGYSQMSDGDAGLTAVVINVERLLASLLSKSGRNIRRIPLLAGPPQDHTSG